MRKNEKRRRNAPKDYKSLFMREIPVTARSRKTIYISAEHHERIIKMMHVIGKGDVTLFAFIYNVLEDHFNVHRDEITDLYEKSIEKVF